MTPTNLPDALKEIEYLQTENKRLVEAWGKFAEAIGCSPDRHFRHDVIAKAKQLREVNVAANVLIESQASENDKLVGQMNKLLERYEKALKKIIEQDGMGADLSPAGSCCEVAREALNREK